MTPYDSLADDTVATRMRALVWDVRVRAWRRATHRRLAVRVAAVLVSAAQMFTNRKGY